MTISPRLRRTFPAFQSARFFVLAMLPMSAVPGWASGVSTGYSGQAFGTAVKVSAATASVTSGTTAAVVLCTFASGKTNLNQVASVGLGPVLSTGAIQTSLSSESSGTTQFTVGRANVAAVNLLGGIVSADSLTAVSTATSSASGYSTSDSGTSFGNLKVLGISIGLNVAPNSRIPLPGIGAIVLNEQISTITASSAKLSVTLIHIIISKKNALGLPVGSSIEVGTAMASTIASISLLSGFAYGTFLSAPPLTVGATAAISLPCGGTTDGKVITNNTLGVIVPAVLQVGATTTTAQGTVTDSSASGETTATVAGFNILSGLIQATAIEAAASGSVNSSGNSFSDQGSSFANLSVLGHPEIGFNPAPNTQVTLAGLGTLYLHRVIQTPNSIEVRMVEVVVTLENALGLPIGADIRVADANVEALTP